DEIQTRTGFSDSLLEDSLKLLCELGLLRQLGDSTYEPSDLHVFLNAEESFALLAKAFRRSTQVANQRLSTVSNAESEFFFSSSFCIDEEKLPSLKAALRETVLQFVDDAIQSNGNRVVHLLTALHK
ncbi:MAG: DUF4423 domain-containing protein, partial [Proteobacteria bacterium]